MSQGTCRYNVDPAPIFLFAYVTGSIFCSAFVVLLAVIDPSFRQANVSVVLETIGYVLVFFGPPYAALSALVMTYYFRYEVTADGVRGQTWLGKTETVRWADVTASRPFNFGNLDFVRLTTVDGTRLWLPMFVRPAAAPESAAIMFASPEQTIHLARLRAIGEPRG